MREGQAAKGLGKKESRRWYRVKEWKGKKSWKKKREEIERKKDERE